MTDDFCLSDKIYNHEDEFLMIRPDDVREFIKRLKDEIESFYQKIDDLAGEKLTK